MIYERVARRKLGLSGDWTILKWQQVGRTKDVVVTLGLSRIRTRGKYKGTPTWEGSEKRECVVTLEEWNQEKAGSAQKVGTDCGSGSTQRP